MAGYTDSAFRALCRRFGADVVMTELISADAVAYGKFKVTQSSLRRQGSTIAKVECHKGELTFNKVEGKNQATGDLLSFFEEERPLVVQLFGKYPEKFAEAAKWITESLKPDGIDINMGCPAKKVVKSGHGVALMKNPDLAIEIIKAVKENTNLPVSVKTRLGWENKDEILEFAPKLVAAGHACRQAGIDAIIIHARTYKQGFKGAADWENIYKVKAMLPEVCVIGNGDVQSILNNDVISSGRSPVERSHGISPTPPLAGGRNDNNNNEAIQQCSNLPLDGVAIGRAVFGKPWIFSKDSVSAKELNKTILTHAELVYAAKGDYGLIEFRKHLLAYLKGNPQAKELRKEAVAISTISDIKNIVRKI